MPKRRKCIVRVALRQPMSQSHGACCSDRCIDSSLPVKPFKRQEACLLNRVSPWRTATTSHMVELRLHHPPADRFAVISLRPALAAACLSDRPNQVVRIVKLRRDDCVQILLVG